ncbi:MAG: hypothetical protein IH949_05000 [Bacteroidetes bacterium]|nr:hypothetical protein [Bacteroidota bacterium]
MRIIINHIKSEWHRIGLKILTTVFVIGVLNSFNTKENNIRLEWEKEYLAIYNSRLDSPIKVHYLEAFVRSGSTNQDWVKSVIPHRTKLISKAKDGSSLHLRSELPYITHSLECSVKILNEIINSNQVKVISSLIEDRYVAQLNI